MKHFEDFEEDQPDQTVTHGGYIAPLPPDHWSLSPEWKKFKAGLSDQTPAKVPAATNAPDDWRGYAWGLAGETTEEETL